MGVNDLFLLRVSSIICFEENDRWGHRVDSLRKGCVNMNNCGKVLCMTGILTAMLSGSCLAYDAPATPLPGAVDTAKANEENANVPGLYFQQTVTLSVDLQAQLDEAKQMVIRGKDYKMAIEAFYWRAVAYNQMEEYYKADEDYESALMLEPTNAGLYYYRGLNWQQCA